MMSLQPVHFIASMDNIDFGALNFDLAAYMNIRRNDTNLPTDASSHLWGELDTTARNIDTSIPDGNITANDDTLMPLSQVLDNEVMEMCERNTLSSLVGPLDRLIRETYGNVETIKHRVLVRGDSPGYERLRFEIHLSGSPEQVLADEKRFNATFFSQIPEDKQDFFSFTYRLTNCHESS